MKELVKLLKKKDVSIEENDTIYNLIKDSNDDKVKALTLIFQKLSDWNTSAMWAYEYCLFKSKDEYLKIINSIKKLLIKVFNCRKTTIEQMIDNFNLCYYDGENLIDENDEDGVINITNEDINVVLKEVDTLIG